MAAQAQADGFQLRERETQTASPAAAPMPPSVFGCRPPLRVNPCVETGEREERVRMSRTAPDQSPTPQGRPNTAAMLDDL